MPEQPKNAAIAFAAQIDRARRKARKAEAPLINRRSRRARVVAAVDINPGSGTEEPRKICHSLSLSLFLSIGKEVDAMAWATARLPITSRSLIVPPKQMPEKRWRWRWNFNFENGV